MNKRLLTFATLLSVAALSAAGCGGDDSPSDQPAPTKAAYIADADAICTAGMSDFEEIVQDLPNDIEAPESQAAISDEIVPLYQDQIDQLRALTPPEGDEDATARIYDAVEEAVNKVEENPSALDEVETFEDANNLATDYGFEVCGN